MTTTTHPLPSTLRAAARWDRLGAAGVPAMLVHPDWAAARPVPVVIWIHGRTAYKEIDPGRYLRLLRAGIAVCALDLPGHGERRSDELQDPARGLEVVLQMAAEIDQVVAALHDVPGFHAGSMGIGGMSAGGMTVLARLCRPHPFACTSIEASTGSWRHHHDRAMLAAVTPEQLARHDPIQNLEGWREIPFQAFHARHDEYIDFDGQAAFIDALRARYRDPGLIDWVTFEHTGAPGEHIGFGRHHAEAKDRQREFFVRSLAPAEA